MPSPSLFLENRTARCEMEIIGKAIQLISHSRHAAVFRQPKYIAPYG